MIYIDDQLSKCCTSLNLVSDEVLNLIEDNRQQLKSVIKHQLVSGKLIVLANLIQQFSKKQQKFILCSKYEKMIAHLRRFIKQSGVACFMH